MSIWDLQAPLYHLQRRLWPLSVILRNETSLASRLLASRPHSDGWALDLGSGPGHSFPLLPDALARVGVDQSPAMAKRCRAHHHAMMVVADACALPFKSDLFTLISAVGLMEYLPSPEPLLTELGRMCRSQGSVLLTTSPQGLFTRLRSLTGARLTVHNLDAVIEAAQRRSLFLTGAVHTFSQQLFLLQKR
ncbi:MAG TPA: class I SAM-dependent methyltransferase [bacterium]|nr:class I SAM-dependent methyltransferase [bacterium]HPN33900.1 class I SAM-dependent methyltransferase [bacterium]